VLDLMLASIDPATAKAVLVPVGKKLVDAGIAKFPTQFKKWQTATKITALSKHVRQVTLVKTLWSLDRPTSLYEFYFPSKVTYPTGIVKQVKSVFELAAGKNLVIQGTVGQGKSIFLRFLCGQELKTATTSNRIPVFVELRRIQGNVSLKDCLYDALNRLGFEMDDEFFDFLASSGQLLFLMDAFDEIGPESVSKTVAYLETLLAKYPETQIIVTSRPEGGVQQIAHFDIVKLTQLAPLEHKPFLSRICIDAAQAKTIAAAIAQSPTDVKELLTTPLLLTLLVILYKANSAIPETLPSFYEQLFDVLYFRHDRSKPGFSRNRHTKLDDSKLKSLFEAFCFQTRVNGKNTLSTESFAKCLADAGKVICSQVDTEAFKLEITKTACLMQEEGFELTFIHKSVAEFHAAAFIQHAIEQVGERFYKQLLVGGRWRVWEQELRFLSSIDEYRYNRFFLIPILTGTLEKPSPITKEVVEHFLTTWCTSPSDANFLLSDGDARFGFSRTINPDQGFGDHEFNATFTSKLLSYANNFEESTRLTITNASVKAAGRNRPFDRIASLYTLKELPAIKDAIAEAFNETVMALKTRQKNAADFVELESQKIALVDSIFQMH